MLLLTRLKEGMRVSTALEDGTIVLNNSQSVPATDGQPHCLRPWSGRYSKPHWV